MSQIQDKILKMKGNSKNRENFTNNFFFKLILKDRFIILLENGKIGKNLRKIWNITITIYMSNSTNRRLNLHQC